MGIEYFIGLAEFASMCSDPDKVDPPPSHENESHEPADGGEAAARYEEGIQLPDCRNNTWLTSSSPAPQKET